MVMKNEQMYYDTSDELYFSEYPGCCGIEVVTGFYVDKSSDKLNSFRQTTPCSLNELHKKFLDRISKGRTRRHIQLSVVTKYKQKDSGIDGQQVPGFKDFLLRNGWFIIDEFINPNHGNKVCVMGKTFRNSKGLKFYF
jgi:hypothetical protein